MDTKDGWDLESTEIFINACIEQINKKERIGKTFTKIGWTNIIATVNAKTGKQYGKKRLKHILYILRKDLKIWDSLIKETGVGRDPVTNNVVQTPDWWQQKIRENSGYKRFRYSCLKHERELRIIFKDVMATEEHIFSPFCTQPHTNEDDVYRPTMDEEEGSGDNEDEHFGADLAFSTGVIDEMTSVRLTRSTPPNTSPSASGSQHKRKRGEGSSQSKKQKVPVVKQIDDAASVFANVSPNGAATLTRNKESSIPEVMKYLLSLEDVKRDKAFGVRCMQALETKARREMFVSLKEDPEYLMTWLRFIIGEQ